VPGEGHILVFGEFTLDTSDRRLWKGQEEVSLGPKAIDVLVYLVENAGHLQRREAMLEALWPGVYVDDHALSVQIREIRKALNDDVRNPRYIETRHRLGYRFMEEVRPVDSDQQPPHATPPALATPSTPVEEVLSSGPPPTRYARSGELNIAYTVIGDGPLDIVFIMGWVSHLEYFWSDPLFSRFLTRLASFSRLILFDKRGTGLSDPVPIHGLPTLEERMDDLRAVMEAVGSEHAVLCGVSEGGPLSILFSATYPEKTLGLVMIGTYARRLKDKDYPWGPTIEEREAFCEQIVKDWGGPIGIDERMPSRASDPVFRQWWATYLRMGASPGAAVALTRMNAEIDVRPVLPAVYVPTLVIHRTGDQCLRVEEGRYLASHIPGARFVELPGSDHLPFAADQDLILDEIEGFAATLQNKLEPERVLATVLHIEFAYGGASLGAGWDKLLSAIRNDVTWHRGQVARLGLSGPLATFDGPARAVRCAWALLERARILRLPFRAGLHTGECEGLGRPDLAGPAVDIAARIQQAAGSGEVLVSGTLRDLVAGSGLRFIERGQLPIPGSDRQWPLLRAELD
jgi:pimeloyl-ACP methyl ester carboxylesterase/DNA-binding winged helix-turn-helix (wHTH) protein